MEQQEKDRQAEALWSVLANPAEKRLHIYDLQNLVNYNPQSGLLHMLIARSGNEEFIKSAAIYYNSPSLYKLVNGREPLPEVRPEQLVDLDTLELEKAPPLDPLLTQHLSGYEPTLEDLALAEINKRRFGTETDWASYDDYEDDGTETPIPFTEPFIAPQQPEVPIMVTAESESTAETIHDDAVTTSAEPVPLVTEEPVVIADSTREETPRVNYFERYRDYSIAENDSEPEVFQVPEAVFTEQPKEGQPAEPTVAENPENTWQSLKFEEIDQRLREIQEQRHQPVTQPAEIPAEDLLQATPLTEQPVQDENSSVDTVSEADFNADFTEELHPDFDHPIEEHIAIAEDRQPQPAYYASQQEQQPKIEPLHKSAPAPVETVNYQTEKPAAASEIDDEVYDEITSIDDFFISPVTVAAKPPVIIPPIAIPAVETKPEPVERKPEASIETVAPEPVTATPEPQAGQTTEYYTPYEMQEPAAQDIDSDEAIVEEEIPYIIPEPQPAAGPIPAAEPEIPANSPPVKEFDDLIAASIVTSDYFSFRRSLKEEEPAKSEAPVPEPPPAEEPHVISKYHDDNMPYTFMWWLDKTRREHADVYQPYAKPAVPRTAAAQGQTENPQPAAEIKKKEEQIIERFIKEEPQIKPPSSDKLDNENKARTSAEDKDELVTETLARIYIDQMLFHKAIATYKKLMLRFPEKSTYFAGQIERLENKIN